MIAYAAYAGATTLVLGAALLVAACRQVIGSFIDSFEEDD
jgi:hypothetical protein